MGNFSKDHITSVPPLVIQMNAFTAGNRGTQLRKSSGVGYAGPAVTGRARKAAMSTEVTAGRTETAQVSAEVTAGKAAVQMPAASDKAGTADKTASSTSERAGSRNRRDPGRAEGGFRLNLNNENLLNSIILSEVLGKPKCLRKGRW